MERRFIAADKTAPVLATPADENTTPKISGLAAVYYDGTERTEFELWTGARERIMPGAFDKALESDDVRALFNHDANLVLGRTTNNTLKLRSNAQGLDYEINPPDTQSGRDALALVSRGDVTGSSFSFVVTDEEWRKEDSVEIREIRGVKLYDVGPVTFPAYAATTSGVRKTEDIAEAKNSHAQWEERNATEEETPTAPNANAMQKRARIAELGL